jgi:hypothetical protein
MPDRIEAPRSSAPSHERHRLLVAHVPFHISESSLLKTLRNHAAVRQVWLARDPVTGQRQGHAYAEVATRRDSDRLVTTVNGRLVDGHAFSVAPLDAASRSDGGAP